MEYFSMYLFSTGIKVVHSRVIESVPRPPRTYALMPKVTGDRWEVGREGGRVDGGSPRAAAAGLVGPAALPSCFLSPGSAVEQPVGPIPLADASPFPSALAECIVHCARAWWHPTQRECSRGNVAGRAASLSPAEAWGGGWGGAKGLK